MKRNDVPAKHALPFAMSGKRNAIPKSSNTAGAASLTSGFPDETMVPIIAGGIPPDGKDMNGVLHELSAMGRWANAGAEYTFDPDFSSAIGGYPAGARLLSSDGKSVFISAVDDNTANPETVSDKWVGFSNYHGAITASSGVKTLSALDAAHDLIVISGQLTGNVQLIFPAWVKHWKIINSATGNFSLTCKTASGSGVVVNAGFLTDIYGDGTSISSHANTDVAGVVRTVNNHKPDVNGDVELKGLDVGAFPLHPDALTVDLNTLGAATQAGVYCQPENAGATTAKHYPVNLAGTLMVTPSAYGCQQEYTTYSTRQKFVRGLTGPWNGKDGPWSDWAAPPAYGWGMGPQHRDDAYNNVAMVYRVNGTSINAPGPNVYGVISLPCDGGPSTSYFAASNSGRAYIGYSNLPANGVIWTEVYTVKNPPTAAGIGAVKKAGDTMTGPLTTPYVASAPNVMPEGAGAYADQLNSKAPFYQPNWQWEPNAGGIFVPIAKGTSTRKGQGYPTAITYGYLMPGTNEFAHPTIHVRGDNNFEYVWDFNPQSGAISSKAGTVAVLDLDIPPGIIHAWPGETPPAGWLMCNGSGFNTSQCPRLAWAFPGGQLPDLRGAFLRGKDNGKGVDPNRGLLSIQPGQAPASAIGGGEWGNYAGRDTGHTVGTGTDNTGTYRVMQETEQQRETRPYNVAINYIVRAA
ncbi:tail fiber protein [Serratia marcescens]|uniref:tail fiber protein n=1 Tax=Serratia marcescens TaxID=615 RepID=UPI001EF14973|nr:tail fiber protein [Serratia marcescens]ULH09876.1 tail fiber protein [Serratia marcescens]